MLLLVAVVALMLAVLPGWGTSRAPETGPWVLGWLAGIGVAVVVACWAGLVHVDETVCATAEGDCDLGGLEGLAWAGLTLVGLTVAWIADGVRRVRRARRVHR